MKGSLSIICIDSHTSRPIFSLSEVTPGKLIAKRFAERLFLVNVDLNFFERGHVRSDARLP